MDHPYRDPEWLREEYLSKDRSLSEIATDVGVDTSTISRWKQKHGIRNKSERIQMGCPVCDEDFVRYRYEVERAEYENFCSRECLHQGRREGMLDWRNSILHGDAREMEELPDESIDLVLTSPPYNLGVKYQDSNQDFEGFDDDRDQAEYQEFLTEVLSECYRVLREKGGRLVLIVGGMGSEQGDTPTDHLVLETALNLGFQLRREIIWDKGVSAGRSPIYGSFMSASSPAIFERHESILVFYTDSFKRPDPGTDTIDKDTFLKSTDSVWQISTDSKIGNQHPAPFPVKLAQRAIELFSFEGDIVLDPFIGSGSTAIAAKRTDREYVGYDISKEYCNLARDRLAE